MRGCRKVNFFYSHLIGVEMSWILIFSDFFHILLSLTGKMVKTTQN